LRAATALGKLAGGLSKSLHRGDGLVIGGRVIMAVYPDAFGALAAGRQVVFVSATNGKTTTTKLLAAAMNAAAPVVTNSSGANMPAGLVAALATSTGTPPNAPAILEADETYLPGLLTQTTAPLLVLGNLSRDQLDRVGEVAMVARRWRKAFADRVAQAGAEGAAGVAGAPAAIANADDPQVVWAASALSDVTWVSVGQQWTADSAVCPACGSIVQRSTSPGETTPTWWCSCGFSRPTPSWRLVSGGHGPDDDEGLLIGPSDARFQLRLQLPGQANQANAALAIVAADRLGVRPEVALRALATVTSVGGRYQTVTLGGRRVRLLLGKNPAGWSEIFGMLAPAPAPVVIAINARAADGKDPSWLWDVEFERLAGRFVLATGERRHDLAVRLLYAGVEHASVADPWSSATPDAATLPPQLRAAPGADSTLDAVGTYTAFRELLRRGGGADDAR
jgi:UDP-N-acetylmuramyl tripeptide synthase